MSRRLLLLLPLLMVIAGPLHAQVELSFPLEGFFRPGKYMPVRYGARNSPHSTGLLYLSAAGAVSTRIVLENGQASGIAPFLPVESALGELRWQFRPDVRGLAGLIHKESGAPFGQSVTSLRALLSEQRLVGLLDPDDLALARTLFPNQSVVPARLDPANPLPGPAIAWETLDAVVLDTASLSRLTLEKRAALLAGGLTIAVKSTEPPDPQWPWKRSGELFVLRHRMAGPSFTGEYIAAFAPVQGWSAGWPEGIRRRALIYAALTSIALLAGSLVRWRWTTLICVMIATGATIILHMWRQRHPVVLEKTGQVMVIDDRIAQTDTWSWQSSGQSTLAVTPWVESLRPMFQRAEDRSQSLLCLQCLPDGSPQMFLYRAQQGLILAFFSRTVGLRWPEVRERASDGPMSLLVERVYLEPDDRIVGTIEPSVSMNSRKTLSEQWDPVVIERNEQ